MYRGWLCGCAVCLVVSFVPTHSRAQLSTPTASETPALERTPAATREPDVGEALGAAKPQPQEKLARIWANEPPLVRMARDKFGANFTETDAKFFAAIAANEWADFRPSPETKYDATKPASWKDSPTLQADRIVWLCSEPAATQLVPHRGIWLRGARIEGHLILYRCTVPFSLALVDCIIENGVNVRNAKLQHLDLTNSCSARIEGRGVEVAENVYLLRTAVFGGIDLIEAKIEGDLDMDGGLAFHGTSTEEVQKPGTAINLYDAKIGGDVKLGNKFRSYGRVSMNGIRIGRSLNCSGGELHGIGESALDVDRAHVGRNVSLNGGFVGDGCVDLRRIRIEGDLDCDTAQLDGGKYSALIADLADIAGQVYLGDGLHAKGEVRFVSAVIGKDADCDNGHFLNPEGSALSFDSTVIGRSLRMGYDTTAATDKDTTLPPGFLTRGSLRLYGTHINQDLLASGGQFEAPTGQAIVACNLRVANRVVISGSKVIGQFDLSAADIEHELDLRGSTFDGRQAYNQIAIWANGMTVRGHVHCNQIDTPEEIWPFRVDGLMSFQFVNIAMSWNLYGAQLINAEGDALEASDCRVGGYVNLDNMDIDGRMIFSRAKIDGMWILSRVLHPEKMQLDMRFAHVWVIKDEKLEDWPRAGKLQLEGFVYDHFDDDSPLSVEDRLAWLRLQYAPPKDTMANADKTDDGKRSDKTADYRIQKQLDRSQAKLTHPAREHVTASDGKGATDRVVQASYDTTVETEASLAENTQPETQTENVDTEGPALGGEHALPNEQTTESASVPAPHVALPDPAGRRYITQPYTQLAAVYRAIGQDEQANAVLVARAERLGELAPPFSAQGLWYRYLGRLIGYGYEPFRAIKIGIGIVIVGTVVFAIGARRHLMAETKLAERVISQEDEEGNVTTTYPRFNAFIYSLDVFLPFVDLHQICYWIPGERNTKPRSRNCLMHIGSYKVKWSGLLRTYFWFQTLAGWTLCTLLAAAVTGIVES